MRNKNPNIYRIQVTEPMGFERTNEFLKQHDPVDIEEIKILHRAQESFTCHYVVVYYQKHQIDGIPVEEPTDSDHEREPNDYVVISDPKPESNTSVDAFDRNLAGLKQAFFNADDHRGDDQQ